MTTSYSYNADKLISTLENILNDVSKAYGYTYDDNGNITSETVTTKDSDGNVEASETIVYTYDDNEQLISTETSIIKYEYNYDDRGNILTEKEYAITVDDNGEKVYTLIEANTDTYVYDETWKDKLISYNGQSITYDAVGNPTNYMGNTLTWTMGRQLASFGNISYTYNEDGIRTSKTSNGVTTKFYLDGTNIIEQTDGTTTLYFFYDSVGEIVGFKYNGNNYLYVKNSMGDIVGIADAAGNLVASYTYDAWGKITSVRGSNTAIGELNPFRYRGYYYDSDIQMYYLQSRYYNPEIGRFINSDDVSFIGSTTSEISYNPFAYCENNPVKFYDSCGTIPMSTIIALVAALGAIIGGIVGYSIVKKNGYTVNDGFKFWSYILGGIVIGGAAGAALGYTGGVLFNAYGAKIAGTLATGSTITMEQIRQIGALGEKLAGITKNTKHIISMTGSAKYRIPDILDKTHKIIGDVKYVKSLSYTKQLQDFYLYAKEYGYKFILYIKPETKLSSTLKDLIDKGEIIVYFITK